MRTFLAVALSLGLAVVAFAADDEKKADTKPEPKKIIGPKKAPAKDLGEPTLKIGSAAPPLKATKWLQGSEVTGFTAGKVYVVEFWAIWCGPCIVMMPHMGEMQAEFREKGVTFIGFSAKDPNNTADKVEEFVKKRGPKLGYTFAFAENRDTYEDYMKAAQQGGIPCSYVVDQQGKIAYIGHPMYLDVVLPKVVDGKWNSDEAAKMKDIEKDVNEVFGNLRKPDAEEGLKAYDDFAKKYPKLADIPYFNGSRINLYIKAKKIDEAKAFSEKLMAKAIKSEDPLVLGTVASILTGPDAKGEKALTAVAMKAADQLLKIGGEKNINYLMTAQRAAEAAGEAEKSKEYKAKLVVAAEESVKDADGKSYAPYLTAARIFDLAGDKEKAKEMAQKAVEAAPNESLKNAIKNALKSILGEEKKKDDN